MKKKYKFLILGSYGQYNLGDDGLLEVFKEQLKDHQLIFSSDNPTLTKRRFGVKAVYTYPQKDFLKKIRALLWCDAVVYGGGTVIIQKTKILGFMFLGNLMAKLLRKRVVYLGVGVGYVHRPFWLRLLTKLVCRTANLITLRDKGSLRELKKAGVNKKKIKVIPGPIFLLKPIAKKKAWELLKKEGVKKKPKLLVGFSPRYHSFPGEYEKFIKNLAKVGDYLIRKYQATLLFIPIQTTFSYSQGYQWRYDDSVARETKKLIKNKEKVFIFQKKKYLPAEIAGVIGLLDLYLAVPLHALMTGFNQGVPIIAVDCYSKFNAKIPSFMKTIDEKDFLIDSYDKVSYFFLKKKVDRSLSSLVKRKKEIKNRKKGMQAKAKQNFNWLIEIMKVNNF